MSHTTLTDGGTVFVHNGDHSGNVRITAPGGGWDGEVPFADLRQFVLGYLRHRMIADLEDMPDEVLEQVLTRSPYERAR